ncbi:MAG: translation initiation factor IF-2 [Candidatus Gastranaerophilales bacterium]|nr:translation initiation factor IF-2 [Candidatus Gastranaerophilales bacterium]MCM1072964.1 translation initiation factor IF-2 [Bacteroides sp.]
MNSLRVSELAKELNMTSKEVIEKFAEISITVKSHSNTVMPDQIRKLKEHLGLAPKKTSAKKAFIVKKAKTTEEPEVVKQEPKKEAPKVERIERVQRVEKAPKIEVVEKPAPKAEEAPAEPVKKVEKPAVRIERTKIEYPKNQSRIEIVRKAPPKPVQKEGEKKSDRPERGERRPFNKNQQGGEKKLVERRIIPQEIYEGKGPSKKKVDNKKKEKDFNSKKEDQEMISLEKAAAQKHKKRSHKEEEKEAVTSIVVNQPMTIQELADKIQKTPAEIVRFLMFQGVMATVNQLIDVETIKKVCAEYELEVLEEDIEAFMEEELEKEQKQKALTEVDKKLLKKRAPVVSIMGHVDHGKTTLLDSIRASKHKIVATEVGGITQSIGAYTVYLDNKQERKIVFVDTPGHEAFTEMRARGAKATDIAILVVAADDGIMPQTIEAINHAKAAEVPIIVAVNKCDKPGANPDKVLQQLTEHGLVPEAWGGETITVNVSALQGQGIDELLEYILLVAEVQDLKANPKAEASGVVIEANLDKGKGPVATLLVQNGTLRTGNCIVVGTACGRVRALLSDSGERIQKAEPSTPVEILGLTEVPNAGDYFEVVQNEKEMKSIIDKRKERERNKRLDAMLPAHMRRESGAAEEGATQLNLIIKANTHGSAEAVAQAIAQFESDEIITKIIHVGVGDISEADVMLASASSALILGFTVKEDSNALAAAEREGVTIKKYDIIYQILEDIEKTMISLLSPEVKEIVTGQVEIRQIFTIGKTVKIAGCYVTEGKINRNDTATIYRDGKEVFKGAVDQLKRFKDDVKEVAQGFECGISFVKFNDIQEGDIVKFVTTKEVDRTELV